MEFQYHIIAFVNHEIYALFFIVIILNLAANPESYVNLENKLMDYLGKISYSIYMWHGVAIIIGLKIALAYNAQLNDFYSNAVYYFVTFVVTLALSVASYEWYEMQFLKFKHLFAKIQSGNLKEEMDKKVANDEKYDNKKASTLNLN